jgi:hypothetical protein
VRAIRSGIFRFGSVVALLSFVGCGGGADLVLPAPPPCNAAGKICYVSPLGSDQNSGADPSVPLASIRQAAQIARDDYTIVVAPGTYRDPVTTTPQGQAPKRLTFLAQGRVVVDVRNQPGAAGFSLANSDGTVIDGFTITGAADAAIAFKSGSDGAVVRNCTIVTNPGEGVRVTDSADVLIFNNLIVGNGGSGIRIGGTNTGSRNAVILHNTIYGNGGRGIEIGNSQKASPGARVVNNIVQQNALAGGVNENIKVTTSPPSTAGYAGDFNLVFPPTYSPASLQGRHDLARDALFVDPVSGDFHLRPASPAIDAGDPLDDRVDLRRILRARTTTGTGLDTGNLDLGFHFLP